MANNINREDLLDCLRELERQRRACWEEGRERGLDSVVAHGYLGMADGFDFAIGEITARFGIELEQAS